MERRQSLLSQQRFAAPMPAPPEEWLSIPRFFNALRNNGITAWPRQVYEELVIDRSSVFDDVLVVHDPDFIQHVFLKGAKKYGVSKGQRHIFRSLIGKHSLVVKEGEERLPLRRMMDEAFSLSVVNSHEPSLVRAAEDVGQRFEYFSKTGEADVDREMNHLAWKVMFLLTLSVEDHPVIEEVDTLLAQHRNSVGKLGLFTFLGLPEWLPEFARGGTEPFFSHLRKFLKTEVRRRQQASGTSSDLLSLYLSSQSQTGTFKMSNESVLQNLLTAFVAGHDSPAMAISWCLYLLANSPDVQQKIHEEVHNTLSGEQLSFSAVNKMPELAAALKETMRLFPPLPFLGREAFEDDEYEHHKIKKGTTIISMPYVLHRHQKLWENPNEFDPDRFKNNHSIHRFSYLPYGVGPRLCPGRHAANYEMLLTLAVLLRSYNFSMEGASDVTPIARITMRPETPLRMKVQRR